MTLEKVEIRNFKSYRGEYVVGPFERFTSIIGPNGSGKSNILDAIIFAMNVPHGSLRIGSPRDLIARGEEDAAVRVYLCGQVFERTIALRGDATQSGYRHGGVRVTAKEYNERLEAINIVGRIKNFVICQGDIIKADIDLLQMIEHVSGSSALAEEYRSLEGRLSAVNRELSLKYEKRKGCLEYLKEIKEGKEKEALFNRLLAEREDVQRRIYRIEIGNKKAEISGAEEDIQALKAERESRAYGARMGQVDEIRAETVKIQKEYFEKESELSYLKSRGPRDGLRNNFLEEKRGELCALEAERGKIEERLRRNFGVLEKNLNRSIGSDLNGGLAALEDNLNEVSSLIDGKEKEFHKATEDEEKALAELTLLNFDKINRRNDLCARAKNTNGKISKIMQRQEEERKEDEERRKKIEVWSREIEMLKKGIEDRESRYDQIVSDEKKKNDELSVVMRDILLNKARRSDSAKRSVVSNVIGNLKGIFSGVHGKVLDLIVPTQKKYELSVGVLLSSYDLAVVVDSESVALDCLRYIKELRACKLTFLPLSRIGRRSNARKEPCGEVDEHASRAKNCIRYDQRYSCVVDFIFGDSLIVDSAEVARSVLYTHGYASKVCTLDGTLFTPTGLITGGRETKNRFDDNLVEALLSKRAAILADLRVIKDRKEAYSEVQIIKDRISGYASQISAVQECTGDGAAGHLTSEDEIRALQNESGVLAREIAVLGASLEDFESEKRRVNESKKEKERRLFSDVLGRLGIPTLSEYKKTKVELGEIKGLRLQLDRVSQEIQSTREEIDRQDGTGASESGPDIRQMEDDVNALYERLEAAKARLRSESVLLRKVNEQKGDFDRRILGRELLKAKLEEELRDLGNDALTECGFQDGDSDDSKENVPNKREDETVSIKDAFRSLSVADLHTKLEDVNRRLEENVPSASTCDGTVQSTYAAVNREYAAAREEAVELRKRFYEVKKARMDAFGSCFSVVSSEISGIYRALSRCGGAEGNAYIVYEGDPFTNRLKYYLMPPTKRFTELGALSGGERSIALLSFIFALNRYRQAPFYIFDEVDSALDKANVERLSAFVLGETGQFVVITLKQQVFQHSDALVGVYRCPREERSKILTYRLG